MMFSLAAICVLYALLILYFIKGFENLKTQESPDHAEPVNCFSILIAFRNEEQHLAKLLESLSCLNYPQQQFEILMINDDSNDGSVEIIDKAKALHPALNIVLFDRNETGTSPKKEAIEQGVQVARHNWIITTDADCLVPKNWLVAFDRAIRKEGANLLVAPVSYTLSKGFVHKFQLLDFMSLQGITMGMFGHKDPAYIEPFLCNGANLCYRKASFLEVNGFSGNENIASGDDVFLLEKMQAAFPEKVSFLKDRDAIVLTSPKDSFKELLYQRIRWASKTVAYRHVSSKLVGLLVFLTNFGLVLTFILCFFGQLSWLHFGVVFLIKFNVDFVLIYKTSAFFEQKESMRSYFISSLLYPFFNVLVVVLSFTHTFTWKDRRY